jgi:hypothetical protein
MKDNDDGKYNKKKKKPKQSKINETKMTMENKKGEKNVTKI